MSSNITLSDHLELGNLVYEWARSYDKKDWEGLQQCLAPSTSLDFRSLQGALHESLSPEEFSAIIADKKVIGDIRVKTQHFVGGSKWEWQNDGTVRGWHQLRVAHQRYADEELTVVENKGHGHGFVEHWYRKVEGKWKIERVAPTLEWSEYDLFGTLNPNKEDS